MAEITTAELNAYLNDYDDSSDILAMKAGMIEAAQGIVEQYLGYVLGQDQTPTTYKYINTASFAVVLPRPVTISQIKLSGTVCTTYTVSGYFYLKDNTELYKNYKDIEVEVTGAWQLNPTPETIKLVIKKIASLLYMESNKRIGVSSVSFPDGNGHQYINYTNYDKHMQVLHKYRAPIRSSIGQVLGAV